MEITRRQFSLMILSAAALCVAAVRWFAARPVPAVAPEAMAGKPVRFVKALTPRSFPGRLRPLDEAEVRKEGKWSG